MPLPEPLQSFDGINAPLAPGLWEVDRLLATYRQMHDASQLLPNTTEAIRVEVTYHSNAIEGNTLSLRETQLVIEGQSPGSGRAMRELYEARNHDRAVRMVEEWSSRPVRPLTERDLLDIHAAVLADIDRREAGRYRSGRVLIAGSRFVPPGPHRFAELIPAALLRAEGAMHQAIVAAELHYNLVAIHPFADGNGRTARLMMNYHLMRRGYPWTIIDVADRAEYMASLDEANAGRIERFTSVIIRSIQHSLRRATGEATA